MKKHRKINLWCAGVLAWSLSACQPADPGEAGFQALQAQEYEQAADHLAKAMEAAEPGSEAHREFAVGHFQALAHSAPKASREGFLALIDSKAIEARERDIETVASELMQAKAFSEAAYVIDVGIRTFPENPRLPQFMDKLITMSKQGDQADLASTLKGIGYGGGD